MRICVVGFGRIGKRAARAARVNGHTVSVAVRRYVPGLIEREADYLFVDSGEMQAVSCELVVLAVPRATILEDSFCLPARVPIASLVEGVDNSFLRDRFPGSLTARFMATPAITANEAIVLLDRGNNDQVNELIKRCFCNGDWREVPSSRFRHYTQLLVAAPVMCEILHRMSVKIFSIDSKEEEVFLAEMLKEASRMLEEHGLNFSLAYESAATPGGVTESVLQELFAATKS